MTDTGSILQAAHQRADELIDSEDKAELGRALIYCGASILEQAQSADHVITTLLVMANSAHAAMAEGAGEQ